MLFSLVAQIGDYYVLRIAVLLLYIKSFLLPPKHGGIIL